MNLLTSDGPGGSVIRRLLPAAIATLIMLGALRWVGQRQGLYGTMVGIILMTVAAISVISGLVWYFARWLDRDEVARRDVEAELRRSSRYFDLSRDMVCTAGFDGVYRQLNAAWTQTLGWSLEELRSRPFVEFVHPDDRARTERETAGLGSGGVTVDFVNRYATKDGGWRWIDWKATASVEEGLIYASARDVTDRKTVEGALEASERHTRQILETAHSAFVSMDAGGLITHWNPQAEASFGWPREEVLGRELAAVIIPEAHREAHRRGLERFLVTGEGPVLGKRIELSALGRDGREFPIELTISALQTERGCSFHAFLRDISEQRRAQQQLALARDEALEASRMKSMFVANVSHEIRTPMNGVIGMSELLLGTGLDAEQREYAETISSSGEALLEIVDGILDLSKIEAGKFELDLVDFDLRGAVERACGMLAARAHEKGLEVVVAIDAGVPGSVHGDGARLRQVIANFVSNAIKFTAEGEVIVRVSSGPVRDGVARVRVEVSDTGIGISREALEQVFKPYTQADGSTTRKYGGTGLGLAISRQLIEMMGGEVGAHSVPGEGSSFWFELSLGAAQSPAQLGEEREIAGLRVVVVDDNAASRSSLQRQLTSWQMSCEVTQSAADAIKLLQRAAGAGLPYALALIDLDMPDVDGYELVAAIRAQPALRDTRLVLLAPPGTRPEDAQQAAVDGLLSKPVRQSRLYEEIQAVMGATRSGAPRLSAPAVVVKGGNGSRQGAGLEVLVVEDTPVNQAVAVAMLAKCGFRAQVAENGRKALQALAEGSFAAVLMDCQMPELDGYETTREIRRGEQGARHVAIIAMTANSMKGERERCLAAGMDDYLTKPLRNQTLKDTLKRWTSEAAPESTGTHGALPDPQGPAPHTPQLLDETVIAELEDLDDEPLMNLVSLYFEQSQGHIAELSRAIADNDASTVAQTAHKLKGSSNALGATHLAHIASELETIAKAHDLTTAHQLLHNLQTTLNHTNHALHARIAVPGDDAGG